jgi:hypothetical protein
MSKYQKSNFLEKNGSLSVKKEIATLPQDRDLKINGSRSLFNRDPLLDRRSGSTIANTKKTGKIFGGKT